MYIFIGSNSGISKKILSNFSKKELIIALYNTSKPKIFMKNIVYKKCDIRKNKFKGIINLIKKNKDKKITLVNF